MNIIEEKIKELKANAFRPKKWKDSVLVAMKKNKVKGGTSAVEKVFSSEYFNEEIALIIISVFEAERKRMENLLKEVTE